MSVRPILFSAPMIRALLDGRKTQTRRIVTPRNSQAGSLSLKLRNWSQAKASSGPSGIGILLAPPLNDDDGSLHRIWPMWEVDDLLWVRETWQDYCPIWNGAWCGHGTKEGIAADHHRSYSPLPLRHGGEG